MTTAWLLAAREDIVSIHGNEGVGDCKRSRRMMHEAARPLEEAMRYARLAGWHVRACFGLRLLWRPFC
jgi:hypothetical protein